MATLDTLRGPIKTIIDAFGKSATLKSNEPWGYDTGTGKARADATSVSVKIVFEDSYGPAETDSRTRSVLLAAQGLSRDPKPKDAITIDSADHEVVDVAAIYTGDEVGLYRVKVAR